MKFFKILIKTLSLLVVVLAITIFILFGVDSYRTDYLDLDSNSSLSENPYIIKDVNIIPMTKDTILMNKTVYIKDGLIQAIDDNIEVDGVEVIDAKNKFLTPGLIDMHVHVWDKYELGLYLSKGVTAVRNVWGRPEHLRIKKEINEGELLSPMFFTTSPKLTGPEFMGDDNLQLKSVEEARAKVISYKSRGYDFIKTYYGLTEELFDGIYEQSELSKMDIIAHPTPEVSYAYHFKPQITSIEHAEDIIQQPLNYTLDSLELEGIVDMFVASPNTSFCPTLTVYHNIYNMLVDDKILSSDQVEMMNPLIQMVDSKAQFERWKNTKESDSSIVERIKTQHEFHLGIIKKLNDRGVNIICGTDAGIGVTVPGFSIHQELAFYKEAGLSNYEVLKTATVNASKTHTLMNQLGTIQVGKVANLLLLEDNPLTGLSSLQDPTMVFIKGRKLNRQALVHLECKAKNRPNLVVSALRYAEYLVFEN